MANSLPYHVVSNRCFLLALKLLADRSGLCILLIAYGSCRLTLSTKFLKQEFLALSFVRMGCYQTPLTWDVFKTGCTPVVKSGVIWVISTSIFLSFLVAQACLLVLRECKMQLQSLLGLEPLRGM